MPFRTGKDTSLSIIRPSIWLNIGECVGSLSRRYTFPGQTIRSGAPYFSIERTCTGDVCVRSRVPSGK